MDIVTKNALKIGMWLNKRDRCTTNSIHTDTVFRGYFKFPITIRQDGYTELDPISQDYEDHQGAFKWFLLGYSVPLVYADKIADFEW